MTLAFPKPKNGPVRGSGSDLAIRVFSDGREVVKRTTAASKREYRRRTLEMWRRQGGRCCLEGYAPMCSGTLGVREATFEHECSRSGGKRDDRIVLPDGTWINGAAHDVCNQWKGSRYIDYNRYFQRRDA